MDVTARHIHEKQFHDAWRGYNQEEVDDFLDRVAEQMGRLERENAALQARLRDLDQMVEASRSTEDMLKKTLVTAQQAAEEAIAKAKAKAHELVSEAEARVQQATEEMNHRVAAAEEEVRRKTAEVERQHLARRRETELSIERLEAFENEIKRRLKAFLDQQLDSLDVLVEKGSSRRAAAAVPQPPDEARPRGSRAAESRAAQTSAAQTSAAQTSAARADPAGRPQATPAESSAHISSPAAAPAAEATAPQAAVATDSSRVLDLDDTRASPRGDPAGNENGDAVRKNPLRGIFRRDLSEEDWSQEQR